MAHFFHEKLSYYSRSSPSSSWPARSPPAAVASKQSVGANDVAVVGDCDDLEGPVRPAARPGEEELQGEQADLPASRARSSTPRSASRRCSSSSSAAEFEQKADDLGIKVTDSDVDKQLATIKAQYFGKDGKCDSTCEEKFQAQIEEAGPDRRARCATTSGPASSRTRSTTRSPTASRSPTRTSPPTTRRTRQQYVQPESRDVRHILVKKKALADQLYQQLKSGANFAALAKKYSTDPSSKDVGRQAHDLEGPAGARVRQGRLRAQGPPALASRSRRTYGWHVIQALTPIKKQTVTTLLRSQARRSSSSSSSRRSRRRCRSGSTTRRRLRESKTTYQVGYAPPATTTARHLHLAVAACRSRTRSSSCKS